MKQITLVLSALFAFGYLLAQPETCSAQSTTPIDEQNLPPLRLDDTIPMDPSIHYGKLPNGLTYYIRRHLGQPGFCDFYLAQKVGSIREKPSEAGFAHFIEHMSFNGTPHFKSGQIVDWCENHGVYFAEGLNASTYINQTVYCIKDAPIVQSTVIDTCLLILHDWCQGSTLLDNEIDKERGVVHEEWRTNYNPFSRVTKKALPILMKCSDYTHCLPVVGSMKVIDNISHEALRRFHKEWYTPEAQCVIVVGDINPDAVEKALKELFADIPKSESKISLNYPIVPDNKKPLVSIVTDKELTQTMVQLYFKKPVISVANKQTVRNFVENETNQMICWMLNKRFEAICEKAGAPFIRVIIRYEDYYITCEKQALSVTVVCEDGKILSGLQAAYLELLRAVRFGFTKDEQQRYTNEFYITTHGHYLFRNTLSNNFFSSDYVTSFIKKTPAYSNALKDFQLSPLFCKLASEQIHMRLKNYVTPDNRAVLIKAPESQIASLPAKKQLLNVLDSTEKMPLSIYKECSDNAMNKPLITHLAQAGSIVKEQPFDFNSTRFVLSNGAKVIVKKTALSPNITYLLAIRSGGNSLYENKDVITARLSNEVVTVGGLGEFSNIDLKNCLSKKTVNIAAASDSLYDYINGITRSGDLETMLQLIYLKFTSPRRDKNAFEVWKIRKRQEKRDEQNNPDVAGTDSIWKVLFNNNDRVRRLKETDIENIDYDRCLSIDRDRYKDASDFTFYIVGDVNQEQIPSLISKYIASLPADSTKEKWINRNITWSGSHKLRTICKKRTPQAFFFLGYNGYIPSSFRNQLTLDLLTKIMRMEYLETIREEKGGTYNVRVRYEMNREPVQMAELYIDYTTDPKKENKLTALIYSKMRELITIGIDANKLNRAKSVLRTQHEKDVRDNEYWLSCLKVKDQFNEDDYTSFESTLDGISAAEIQRMLKTLIGQKNETEFILSSEIKAN